jgi:hypothetical protein
VTPLSTELGDFSVLPSTISSSTLTGMATITEVERLAFDLPEAQRAVLAAHLLDSLSPVLRDEDDGLQEALIRDRELDSNPSSAFSLEQLDHQIRSRRSS